MSKKSKKEVVVEKITEIEYEFPKLPEVKHETPF
jgi:hypothetical protein